MAFVLTSTMCLVPPRIARSQDSFRFRSPQAHRDGNGPEKCPRVRHSFNHARPSAERVLGHTWTGDGESASEVYTSLSQKSWVTV